MLFISGGLSGYNVRISPLSLSLVPTIKQGKSKYEGWNFNSGNYLFTTDTK